MNFFAILNHLADVDPDVLGRFNSRRAVFHSLGTATRRAALAATPLFVGALFQKAYAGTTSTAADILNYALTLELLEADFYAKFLAAGTLTGAASQASTPLGAITKIKQHEDAHVRLLQTTLATMGAKVVSGVTFKASALPASYAGQLQVAQLLEDTGVRAYKGRAAELLATDLLTTALRIHSMEARHAAHIRTMRGQLPWASSTDDLATDPAYGSGVTAATSTVTPFGYGVPAYTAPSAPESNTKQAGMGTAVAIEITTLATPPYAPLDAAAAFDEALQPAEVLDASRAGKLVQT